MRVNTPRVSHQTIEGEVVVINLENGCYYSLLSTAASIWQLVAAGTPRGQIVSEVTSRYPDAPDAASATTAFLDELLAEQLVSEEAADQRADAQPDFPSEFSAPVLERFTDMQELLMLDPIHEVDSMGWPHKPAQS